MTATAGRRTRSPTGSPAARPRRRMSCRRRSCRSGAIACGTTRRAGACAPGSSGSSTTEPSTGCRATLEVVEERFEAPERTDVEVARREEARTVRGALGTLPDEQRKTIELAYFGGFTHTQIAEMLHEPIGTVKGRMRLGLDKMRRQLAEGAT